MRARRPAGSARAGAAPTAACAARRGGAAAAARARRSRGSGSRTAPSAPSSSTRSSSTSSGSGTAASALGRRRSPSAKRSTMPSSVHSDAPGSRRRRRAAPRATSAHGACTRAPNGDRMQTRQSPSSSRKRSIVIASIGRQRAGRLALLGEVATRFRAARASSRYSLLAATRARPRRAARRDLAHERAERAAELDRPPGPFAAPERHLAGLARRGRDDHAVARDLLRCATSTRRG